MKEKISLMIVDDHQIFRDGLKMLLSHFPFVGEMYETSDGREFLEKLKDVRPDIVFMDINMPVMGGIEATSKALAEYPDLKIIVLTTFHDDHYVDQMLMAGVEGYMLKRSTPDEFESAILKVHTGGNFFSDEILATVTKNLKTYRKKSGNRSSIPEFTEREHQVLELLCQGYNNEKISGIIHLSPKTIEKYKSSLFQKTDTNNTVNLIIYAFRNGIVDVDEKI